MNNSRGALESPLVCLSSATCDVLAARLDSRKILQSEHGYQRDWRGVLQLFGGSSWQLHQLQRLESPTLVLLQRFHVLPVSRLQESLALVGRHDVWDAVESLVESDTAEYLRRLDSSGMGSASARSVTGHSISSPSHQQQLLCVGDAERVRREEPLLQFDAFLLYDESDSEFAREIVSRMEKHGLLLCEKDRHLLPGIPFEHEGTMKLIRERCRRVLAVLSPLFLQSPINSFLTMFAHADSLESGRRCLIPCVARSCTLPPHLLYCSRLDFTRSAGRDTLWQRMFDSISQLSSPTNSRQADLLSSPGKSRHADSLSIPTNSSYRSPDVAESVTSGEVVPAVSLADKSNPVSGEVVPAVSLREQSIPVCEEVVSAPSPSTRLFSRVLRIHDRMFSSNNRSSHCLHTDGAVSSAVSASTALFPSVSNSSSSAVSISSSPAPLSPELCCGSSEFLLSSPSPPVREVTPARTTVISAARPSSASWSSVLKAARKKRKSRIKLKLATPAS